MDGSYDETVREAKEGSGLTRGGARFQQEKRQRIEESPTTTETQGHIEQNDPTATKEMNRIHGSQRNGPEQQRTHTSVHYATLRKKHDFDTVVSDGSTSL